MIAIPVYITYCAYLSLILVHSYNNYAEMFTLLSLVLYVVMRLHYIFVAQKFRGSFQFSLSLIIFWGID